MLRTNGWVVLAGSQVDCALRLYAATPDPGSRRSQISYNFETKTADSQLGSTVKKRKEDGVVNDDSSHSSPPKLKS